MQSYQCFKRHIPEVCPLCTAYCSVTCQP